MAISLRKPVNGWDDLLPMMTDWLHEAYTVHVTVLHICKYLMFMTHLIVTLFILPKSLFFSAPCAWPVQVRSWRTCHWMRDESSRILATDIKFPVSFLATQSSFTSKNILLRHATSSYGSHILKAMQWSCTLSLWLPLRRNKIHLAIAIEIQIALT